MPGRIAVFAFAALAAAFPRGLPAAERFVSPSGSADGDGSRPRPWDLATALAGRDVRAGDTVWLRGGTYRGSFMSFGYGPLSRETRPGELIDVVAHDLGCVCLWKEAIDMEVSGSLIYANGWKGPDRGHGHGIYVQNAQGKKSIDENVSSRISTTESRLTEARRRTSTISRSSATRSSRTARRWTIPPTTS